MNWVHPLQSRASVGHAFRCASWQLLMRSGNVNLKLNRAALIWSSTRSSWLVLANNNLHQLCYLLGSGSSELILLTNLLWLLQRSTWIRLWLLQRCTWIRLWLWARYSTHETSNRQVWGKVPIVTLILVICTVRCWKFAACSPITSPHVSIWSENVQSILSCHPSLEKVGSFSRSSTSNIYSSQLQWLCSIMRNLSLR